MCFALTLFPYFVTFDWLKCIYGAKIVIQMGNTHVFLFQVDNFFHAQVAIKQR